MLFIPCRKNFNFDSLFRLIKHKVLPEKLNLMFCFIYFTRLHFETVYFPDCTTYILWPHDYFSVCWFIHILRTRMNATVNAKYQYVMNWLSTFLDFNRLQIKKKKLIHSFIYNKRLLNFCIDEIQLYQAVWKIMFFNTFQHRWTVFMNMICQPACPVL